MWKPTFAATLLIATVCFAQVRPASGPATAPIGPAAAAKPPTTAPSKVIGVTVYQGTALVTREVEVPAGQGLVEVVVSPLPPQTIDSSLYTEATDGLRILSTRYRTRAVKEDTRAEVRALQDQIKKMEAEQQRLQKEMQVAEQNLLFVGKLEQFTAATMQTLAEKGMLNGETTITLSKYVMSGREEIGKRQVELQQSQQANQEAIAFANRQLGELSAGASRTERDAVIVVDKANNAAGKVNLNYLVSAATWRPRYKLRAGADKDAVQLEYLAAIEQQSGEDWVGADMILSTAQPMLNAAPPELLALDITVNKRAGGMGQTAGGGGGANGPGSLTLGRANYDQSQQLRAQAQKELNGNNSYVGGTIINEAAALEQTEELLNPVAVDFNNKLAAIPPGPRDGPSVIYHLKSKLTVPSRNDEQLIEVARIELAPEYFYKAVPVLTPHVYRQATLTNKSEYVLLPGEATMYVGKDFVGRMTLPLVAIGEQFVAGFGVDPQLQVVRTMVNKTRTLQGANQVYAYDYRLRVSSYKTTPVKLQLWDRLPKADAEAVGVSLIKTSPELSQDPSYTRDERPDNLLRWDLTIEPGMTGEKAKEVTYQFKLEYAREVSIGNFKSQQKK
jgi:uncharacterized protein (TIGR02231 family)